MPGSLALSIVGIVLLAGVAALLLRRRGGASLGARLAQARANGELAPLLEWIEAHGGPRRLDAFNRVIRGLWDDYERELATRVIRELGARHAEERIAQYWLDQAQRVEPELAARLLDREYLAQHFRPEVAARCGQFG
jgi:hypothetical protein